MSVETEIEVTPEMISAGLKEWFADAWAETDEDRITRVFLAMYNLANEMPTRADTRRMGEKP